MSGSERVCYGLYDLRNGTGPRFRAGLGMTASVIFIISRTLEMLVCAFRLLGRSLVLVIVLFSSEAGATARLGRALFSYARKEFLVTAPRDPRPGLRSLQLA